MGLDQKPSITKLKAGQKSANIFSISPGTPFLQTLVSALCNGQIFDSFHPTDDPLTLADAIIYVPNRRTARALTIALIEKFDASGILPDIRTLGDVEEDEFGLLSSVEEEHELPHAVSPLARQLELAGLVQRWVDALSAETRRLYDDEDIFIPSSQADAIKLARELCDLLDQITREERDWETIQKVVPQEHAQWWSLTAAFLQIVLEHWPQMLAERGLMDPSLRARELLNRRIESLEKNGSRGPIIVAGSTGSVPSTQRFLKIIAGLENGAVVLPGLDFDLPDQQWRMLTREQEGSATESHPQFGLAKLLSSIRVARQDVSELAKPMPAMASRGQIISTALALPEHTASWRHAMETVSTNDVTTAFDNVALIEAANERHEALAIAVALREVLETPDKTAALVTPDRNLARRVSMELQRFGVEVDDTAGQPFSASACGRFIRQLVRLCFGVSTKADLTTLLKSPLAPIGNTMAQARSNAEKIELVYLRGAIGQAKPGYLADWLTQHEQQNSRDFGSHDPEALAYAAAFDACLLPLAKLVEHNEAMPLSRYIEDITTAVASLSCDETGASMFAAVDGMAEMQALFEEILATDAADFDVIPIDFPTVFDALVSSLTVRPHRATHPRLHIYGPLEIRLLDHDRIIMSGLNEGTWPRATRNDAFLNRLMRTQIGIPSPERTTGLAAHDFQQIMGKREVLLSRSTRVDRAPAIASRWIQRLLAVIGEDVSSAMKKRGEIYLQLAGELETENKTNRVQRPAPKPPIEARPTSLPVTDIETWIRDPYALYAKRILKLKPVEPLEREADARLKGTLYHAIMEDYVSLKRKDHSEEDRLKALLDIALMKISEANLSPDVEMLWTMNLEELAKHFIAAETQMFNNDPPVSMHKEVKGSMRLPDSGFYLHARADRIDVKQDGLLVVLDYKTGGTPSKKQARTLSPQLALEGAIGHAGGFENIGAAELADLVLFRLRNGKNFVAQSIADKGASAQDLAEQALTNLEALIAGYQDKEMGYVSRRAPFREGEITGDYDHLARTREWSFGEEDGDE